MVDKKAELKIAIATNASVIIFLHAICNNALPVVHEMWNDKWKCGLPEVVADAMSHHADSADFLDCEHGVAE